MKRRRSYELPASLLAVLAITAWYVPVSRDGVPRPGSLLGLGVGVVGLLLMLSTEVLYSLRKRLPGFTVGPLNHWLQAHVFTGIVGPYLVLLHTGGKFNGLAGAAALVTVIMVVSGFVGRYLYTAVPRTPEGAELAVRQLEEQAARLDSRLRTLGGLRLPQGMLVAVTPQPGWLLVLGRPLRQWRQRRRLRKALANLGTGVPAAQLEALLADRYRLQEEIASLAATRRLLALWHAAHVPLGMVLFTLAFIHVGAALYYGALLK
jgi:hypothetical protein